MTATSVEIDNLLPARQQGRSACTGSRSSDDLFSGMLSARFAEMAQKPDAPFLARRRRPRAVHGAHEGRRVARARVVKEDGVERGLEALFTEAERVARFGFTATELDRQKQNMLRELRARG